MPRHSRRSGDPYEPAKQGHAGDPEEVAHFDANVSKHVVNAADKRLHGESPYDQEPGNKPTVDRDTGTRRGK